MKKTFTVTDKYDREFIFVGSEEQIIGLQELCMAESFCSNLIKLEDELGIFSLPLMQGVFTPNEDGDYVRTEQIPHWMSENLPGFHLEFIDEDDVPYFSTCDGLQIWYKEHYEWYLEVLRLNQQVSDINTKMLSSSKADIKRCEYELILTYKKLDDMDFYCIDVVEFLSQPIKLYRHVVSSSDMATAFSEIYA